MFTALKGPQFNFYFYSRPAENRDGKAFDISLGKHVRVMFTPLNSTFIKKKKKKKKKKKMGFAGIYLNFVFLTQNIHCGYSLEPPPRGGSNVYPPDLG